MGISLTFQTLLTVIFLALSKVPKNWRRDLQFIVLVCAPEFKLDVCMGISRKHDVATPCVQFCCTLTHFSRRENSPTRSLLFYQVRLPFELSSSSADLDKHPALCLHFAISN